MAADAALRARAAETTFRSRRDLAGTKAQMRPFATLQPRAHECSGLGEAPASCDDPLDALVREEGMDRQRHLARREAPGVLQRAERARLDPAHRGLVRDDAGVVPCRGDA